MAFNFNWSPLSADPTFYTRAQDLLTNALNKSPKPPIIVDDIIVSEMNLGSVPPELEILEVGDMAEDRFRGIFKMRYAGDAFLTLRTRVQANPMNTYLSTSAAFSSFASPEPLAAGSSLTIPIKITLSDIKLSAFIILVFSRSKGLTLVFRNDPLESLKVSSTFDSIPFVRDFLQKTIEQQLRNLLMEDVPAIIHRLSLRWFVPEYRAQEEALANAKEREESEEEAADPFSSPPQDPVDMNGHPLGTAEITALTLESHTDTPSVFSQTSLLRLAALTDSHRTLSPFTPTMKDVLFRVWAGRAEQLDTTGFASPLSTTLSRKQSQVDLKGTTYTFSNASETASLPSRPSLVHTSSSFNRSNLSSTKSGKPRKRKHRTINLRKRVDGGDLPPNIDETLFSETASTVTSDSASHPGSAPGSAQTLPTSFGTPEDLFKDGNGEVSTPPASPEIKRGKEAEKVDAGKTPQRLRDFPDRDDDPTIRRPQPRRALFTDSLMTPEKQLGSSLRHSSRSPQPVSPVDLATGGPSGSSNSNSSSARRPRPSRYFQSFNFPPERPSSPFVSHSPDSGDYQSRQYSNYSAQQQQQQQPQNIAAPFPYGESAAPGGILEQAWMMKMAGEIAKRMHEQEREQKREASSRQHDEVVGARGGRQACSPPPPPPYAA